jgi:hypothetical protein
MMADRGPRTPLARTAPRLARRGLWAKAMPPLWQYLCPP